MRRSFLPDTSVPMTLGTTSRRADRSRPPRGTSVCGRLARRGLRRVLPRGRFRTSPPAGRRWFPLLGFRSGGRAVQLGGGPCAPAAAACRFGWPRWLSSVPRFPWVPSPRRVTPSRARATMASTWSTAGAVACGAARRDGALPGRRARQRSSGRRRGPTRPGSGSRRLADRALSVPGLLGRLSCSSAVLVLRDFASRGLLPAFLPGARVSSSPRAALQRLVDVCQ